MASWAWSTCGRRLGRRFACSSTAMARAGWRGSWRRKASASPPPTMLSFASTIGRVRKRSRMACRPDRLHLVLDRYAALCCPVQDVFEQSYHGSLMQVEYATDLVFRSATTLGPPYEQLTRESVLSVKAEQIATFLGRQITPQLAQEIGSQFSTRIEGACIKHRFGNASIKMYDK